MTFNEQRNNTIIPAYPIYFDNIPRIVHDFIILNHTASKGKNIFIIATMGLFSADGAGCSASLLAKHGTHITGRVHLKMSDCIGDEKALKKQLPGSTSLFYITLLDFWAKD